MIYPSSGPISSLRTYLWHVLSGRSTWNRRLFHRTYIKTGATGRGTPRPASFISGRAQVSEYRDEWHPTISAVLMSDASAQRPDHNAAARGLKQIGILTKGPLLIYLKTPSRGIFTYTKITAFRWIFVSAQIDRTHRRANWDISSSNRCEPRFFD